MATSISTFHPCDNCGDKANGRITISGGDDSDKKVIHLCDDCLQVKVRPVSEADKRQIGLVINNRSFVK